MFPNVSFEALNDRDGGQECCEKALQIRLLMRNEALASCHRGSNCSGSHRQRTDLKMPSVAHPQE